jgi:hypothetical protein
MDTIMCSKQVIYYPAFVSRGRRRKKRRRRRRRNVLECSYFVCEILDFHGDEYSNSGVTVVTPED